MRGAKKDKMSNQIYKYKKLKNEQKKSMHYVLII